MTKLIFLFLLLASPLYAATTFTIKQGTTTFGPFQVQTLNKYTVLEIDRTLWAKGVTLDAQIQTSMDKGTTWANYCRIVSVGDGIVYGGATGNQVKSYCGPFPPTVTDVKIIATVTGGDLVLPKQPNAGSKP